MQHNSRIVNKKIESVWVDEIEGLQLTENNVDELADMVKGSVIFNGKPFVTIPTPRGELLVREGDFVGKDQRGNWHIVRLRDTSKDEIDKGEKKKSGEEKSAVEKAGKEVLSSGQKFLRSVAR